MSLLGSIDDQRWISTGDSSSAKKLMRLMSDGGGTLYGSLCWTAAAWCFPAGAGQIEQLSSLFTFQSLLLDGEQRSHSAGRTNSPEQPGAGMLHLCELQVLCWVCVFRETGRLWENWLTLMPFSLPSMWHVQSALFQFQWWCPASVAALICLLAWGCCA